MFIRKLVSHVAAPRRDHRQHEPAALLEQNPVDTGIVHVDLLRHVSNIKFDRATAARFEVDEDRAFCGAQQVAWMRLSVQKLVHVRACRLFGGRW